MAISLAMAGLVKKGFETIASRWNGRADQRLAAEPGADVIALPSSTASGVAARLLPPCPMEETLIQQILDRDYAAAGRGDALRERNEEAHVHALQALRTIFDNTLARVASSYAERGYELEQLRIDLRDDDDGKAPQTDLLRKVRLALVHNQRRIEDLQEQRRLAEDERGWFGSVSAAYAAGFQRGLREAFVVDRLSR